MFFYFLFFFGFSLLINFLLSIIYYPVNENGAILVTGCSSGLGLHISLFLDKLGYKIYSTVRKEIDAVKIKKISEKINTVILDVTDRENCIKKALELESELKKTDQKLIAIINNAGISRRCPMELENLEDIKNLYEVNVFGVFNIINSFVSLLKKNKNGGRIINIGSIAGFIPEYGSLAYSGSKAALKIMSEVIRCELVPYKISVSLIEPAYIKTKMCFKQTKEINFNYISEGKKKMYTKWSRVFLKKRLNKEKISSDTNIIDETLIHALSSNYPNNRYIIGYAGYLPSKLIYLIKTFFPSKLTNIFLYFYNKVYY